MTYKENIMASTNHTESFNLLLTGSESGSDIPDFTVPKRKVRVKRKNRPTSSTQRKRSFGIKHGAASFCNSSCSTSLCVSFVMIVVAILMVLIWFIIQLRFQIDQLNSKFNNVEASNNGMPEELHDIHTKMNNLEKNYALIKQNITKLSDGVIKINKQIQELHTASQDIKQSIAAAPLIKNLPGDVMKLTENVATIGSKITNVEDKLEKLKMQHSDFDEKHKSFTSAIKQVQNAVSSMKLPTAAKSKTSPADGDAISQLHRNIQSLEKEITDLNSTLSDEMKSVSAETTHLSEVVKTMPSESGSKNINDAIKKFINETVKQSLFIHLLDTDFSTSANISVTDVLTDVNKISQLYLHLLKKFNLSSNAVLHLKNSSLVVEDLVNRIETNIMCKCCESLSNDVQHLNSSVLKLQGTEKNITLELAHALLLINQLSLHHVEGSSTTETVPQAASTLLSETTIGVVKETTSPSSSKSNNTPNQED